MKRESRELTIPQIVDVVAWYYGLTSEDLLGRRRPASIAEPRMVAYYCARRYGNFSYPEIGREMNKRNHTAVRSGCIKVKRFLKGGDRKLIDEINGLTEFLG